VALVPEELAERLGQMLTQTETRSRMGAAARIWVERLYAWPAIARRTAGMYQSLLSTRSPAPAWAKSRV
jgi:glycosyltransferase involved in cell wall biosynthesis